MGKCLFRARAGSAPSRMKHLEISTVLGVWPGQQNNAAETCKCFMVERRDLISWSLLEHSKHPTSRCDVAGPLPDRARSPRASHGLACPLHGQRRARAAWLARNARGAAPNQQRGSVWLQALRMATWRQSAGGRDAAAGASEGGGGAQQPRRVERAAAALQVHSRDLHFGGVSTFTQESTCACEAAAAAELLTSGVARGATHTRRQG